MDMKNEIKIEQTERTMRMRKTDYQGQKQQGLVTIGWDTIRDRDMGEAL